jgi:hypothetical protein
MLFNAFRLHYLQVLCQSSLCKGDYVCITYLVLQQQLGHVNGRKLGSRQDEAFFLCLASPHPMLRTCSFSRFFYLRLLLAQFWYIIVYLKG